MLQEKWDQLLIKFSKYSTNKKINGAFSLQEQLIVGASILYLIATFLWGIMYFMIGEPVAGAIPFGYSIFLGIMFAIFLFRRNAKFYVRSQHLLTLLLPFLLQITLGGFRNSSAVILWSFTTPLMALIHNEPKNARRWFIAFILILILGGLLDPLIQRENNISPTFILILFVMNLLVVLGISFTLLYYLVTQKDNAFQLLSLEREKSEKLLLNVLPIEISKRLKDENRLIADSYAEASVLFADMVGFTPLSAELSPAEMVELLNDIYTKMDTLVDQYGLEKIRTIGDNYMVAAGVPLPRDDHAHALASIALDICDFAESYQTNHGKPVQFRVGINSGSVIAGVVGQRKFHYDVWGDMVNVASRMESQGFPGKIQITDVTHRLIKDKFDCEPRGTIDVKGKGEMKTWFLVGSKT